MLSFFVVAVWTVDGSEKKSADEFRTGRKPPCPQSFRRVPHPLPFRTQTVAEQLENLHFEIALPSFPYYSHDIYTLYLQIGKNTQYGQHVNFQLTAFSCGFSAMS